MFVSFFYMPLKKKRLPKNLNAFVNSIHFLGAVFTTFTWFNWKPDFFLPPGIRVAYYLFASPRSTRCLAGWNFGSHEFLDTMEIPVIFLEWKPSFFSNFVHIIYLIPKVGCSRVDRFPLIPSFLFSFDDSRKVQKMLPRIEKKLWSFLQTSNMIQRIIFGIHVF